jgi:C4-dicarboxylate-specific signal transduction histidine kinase
MALGADNAADALEAEGASGIAEAVETLRRVAGQASRAQAIIDHLRVFGRRDPGPLGPVEVDRAVEGALVLAANALRSAGIVVERHVPPGLPAVQAQIVLLEQVLLNLFLNARDALVLRPEGTRRIIVSARQEASGRVLVLVRDTGGGVPPDVIDRVFEPFYTTKPVGQGTGLGLALCHGMMAALGGSIRVSNVDGGAEFVLDLAPAVEASAPVEKARDLV